MADEFQTGFCAGNWWNSSKTVFGSSPCSSALNDIGSLGWGSELIDMKERSSDASGNSVSDGSLIFQDIQKHNQTMDSTMGIGLSSSTDWNQALNSGSGRTARNDNPMLQEDLNSSLNYRQENGIRKDWSPKNFSSDDEDSSINAFKIPNQGFSLDSMSSTSYGYPSNFVQALFDDNSQPQQSLIDNQSINYPFTTNNYQTKLNEFSPSLPKFSSLLRPSLPKHQPISHLHLSNHTPFLNYASAGALSDIRASFFASTQSQFLPSTFEEKPNFSNLTKKLDDEEVGDSGSVVKKGSNEPAFKRQRIETPSPLPTFRVRKEKLGDRITALQQLVSPFGKTDTASVLHEAIEYIKLLHGQVNILSTPYMRSGAPIQLEQIHDNLKDTKVPKQNLRSRGLCLVQIPSTFPVAPETTADFWTPTFGGAFR